MKSKTVTRAFVRGAMTQVRIEIEGKMEPRSQRAVAHSLLLKAMELLGYDVTGWKEYPLGNIYQPGANTWNQEWLLKSGIPLTHALRTETAEQKTGYRIRVLRLEIGMSQAELALRAGIDRSHLSEIEHGRCRMRAETQAALFNILKPDRPDKL
jgi:DNA-binding XRE family transcriptional regulator